MNREELVREIRERFRQSSDTLNELQRRHWAAQEAIKLGRGGITIVSQSLRISPNTIRVGIQEIHAGRTAQTSEQGERIRKPGGGRKSKTKAPDPNVPSQSNSITSTET
jgi:hypothetical protein